MKRKIQRITGFLIICMLGLLNLQHVYARRLCTAGDTSME